MAFCPKCGKTGITGRFCRECAKDESAIDIKDVEFKVCSHCKKLMHKNKWREYKNLEEEISLILSKETGKKNTTPEVMIPNFEKKEGMDFDGTALIQEEDIEFEIPFKITVTRCNACAKKNTEYFEGILQLRNPNQQIIDFVSKEAEKNSGKGVHINKAIDVKNGLDLYITKKNFLKRIGKSLQETFGGELKINEQLFSRNKQTSKNIYRLNVLFRNIDYEKGDKIMHNGNEYVVERIGKDILARNESGKIHIPFKEISK